MYLHKYLFVYLIQRPVVEGQCPTKHVCQVTILKPLPVCHLGSLPTLSSSKFLSSANYCVSAYYPPASCFAVFNSQIREF